MLMDHSDAAGFFMKQDALVFEEAAAGLFFGEP